MEETFSDRNNPLGHISDWQIHELACRLEAPFNEMSTEQLNDLTVRLMERVKSASPRPLFSGANKTSR
jgi:hypothetical protein